MDAGLATALVLHDLNAALRHCDEVLLLHGGRVLGQAAAGAGAGGGAPAHHLRCGLGIPADSDGQQVWAKASPSARRWFTLTQDPAP